VRQQAVDAKHEAPTSNEKKFKTNNCGALSVPQPPGVSFEPLTSRPQVIRNKQEADIFDEPCVDGEAAGLSADAG